MSKFLHCKPDRSDTLTILPNLSPGYHHFVDCERRAPFRQSPRLSLDSEGARMSRGDERSVTVAVPESTGSIREILIAVLPALEIAGCLVLAALLLWKGILPGCRILNTDFPNYYLGARLLREGYGLDRIYDWIWLQRIKDHWGLDQPLVGFAGLTPFSALPLLPFSMLPALVAKRIWIVASLLFLSSSVELLSRVTSLGRRRIWLLALLAIFPLRTSFLFGQMHLLILLLLVAAYYFHQREQPIACGICLAVAGSLKIYPLLFAGYFLWKRQWRPALSIVCTTILLVGCGYLCFGSDAMNIYSTQILPRSLQGEVLDPYNVRAASGSALFHKLFIAEPQLNPVPWRDSPSLYAVLYPLWQLAVMAPLFAVLKVKDTSWQTTHLEWGAFVLALLVLSPVPSSYHFVAVIFSVSLLIDVLRARQNYRVAGFAIALYCLLSIIDFLPINRTGVMPAFARLWVGLLLWAVFLSCLWPDRAKLLETGRLRLVCLCVLVVVAWIAGTLGYYRHFDGLNQEMARRITTSVKPYLASSPHLTSSGYVYTAMQPQGYRVLDQSGRVVWNAGYKAADQLSVAAATKTPVVLLELADETGSRIVAIPSGRLLISHAESPAVSSDGSSVAFIRDILGKGTLWTARLEPQAPPERITDPAYDVDHVTYAPSGWIMFSARLKGRLRVFRVLDGKVEAVSSSEEDVDSPAVSPDERFFAFRKLVKHRWQLGYRNLLSGDETLLTGADCNVYTPTWAGRASIAYATDCGRGFGLSALALANISQVPASPSQPGDDNAEIEAGALHVAGEP